MSDETEDRLFFASAGLYLLLLLAVFGWCLGKGWQPWKVREHFVYTTRL